VSESTLNDRVLQYQRSGEGLETIMAEIGPRIYRYPLSAFGLDEDDCGAFFLFVYPRLLRTLERFQDRGKPFEWYLNSVLRWQLREYRRRRSASEESWMAAAQPGLWDAEARGAFRSRLAPASLCLVDGQVGSLEALWRACGPTVSRAAGRRILFWAFKHPSALTAQDLEFLAAVSGIPESFLEAALRAVEDSLHEREQRLSGLYQRRNRAYARCLHLQARLQRELDPERKAQAHLRLDKALASLHRTARRLATARVLPSNREIARALEVPKGTVDSSLYWLRRRAEQELRSSA
jgi:RNA polymerase sigma factor (sigma-70 family)